MLFFSTTDHKRRAQQWSYKQKFLLLNYSAHLSLGVHYNLKVNFFFITLLSLLLIKKPFLFSFSLFGFSPSFFLPQLFFLSCSPASSLIFLIPQLVDQLPHRWSISPTQLTNPPQAPSSISPSPIAESTRFPSTQMGYCCFRYWSLFGLGLHIGRAQ